MSEDRAEELRGSEAEERTEDGKRRKQRKPNPYKWIKQPLCAQHMLGGQAERHRTAQATSLPWGPTNACVWAPPNPCSLPSALTVARRSCRAPRGPAATWSPGRMLEGDDAISILSEKVLERDKKEREEGRGHSKTGDQQSRDQGGNGTAPSAPFPAPGRHCRPRRQEPGTHWLTGLEPAPLRERPAGQDDTGQGCRLPLQHPDGGGAASDLWGCCGERRWCGSRWIPVGSHLGDPGDASGTGILRGHRAHCPGSRSPGAPQRTWP